MSGCARVTEIGSPASSRGHVRLRDEGQQTNEAQDMTTPDKRRTAFPGNDTELREPGPKRIAWAAGALLLSGCGGGGGGGGATAPPVTPPPPPPPLSSGPALCVDGRAADFPCSGVALRSRIAPAEMGGGRGSDIWGWVDPDTGREYALVGLDNGTAFVDVTDPEAPVFVGRLPTRAGTSIWRDIKVYRNHAYVVADNVGVHGMQVFDLTRLRDATPPETFSSDIDYVDFEDAHNLAINEATGYAYAVGTNTCSGGLHMIDITTPTNPLFAGCHEAAATHDTQCVTYLGPDLDHAGSEICVSSNGDQVGIDDVTDKTSPVTLASVVYPQLGFAHQGWLTEDHRFFLLGDEGDENAFGVATRTHVFDLSDLDAPEYVYPYEAATTTVDHNLYVLGTRVYEANYSSGLRVLEFGDLANRDLAEIAFFDTIPDSDAPNTLGAWGVYPFLPSGVIIVSDATTGLFVLSLD